MPDVREVRVALTGEQIAAMTNAVKAGEYRTTDEIVQEAMELWQCQRALVGMDATALAQAWDTGKASGPATALDIGQLRQEARERLRVARSHAG